MNNVSPPPENYPIQEDYSTLILRQRFATTQVHDAFLCGDYLLAQRYSTEMFDIAAALTKLSSVLLIERNLREQVLQTKSQPTIKQIISGTYARIEREKEEYESARTKAGSEIQADLGAGKN